MKNMKILKCTSCGEYTLREKCPKCGSKTVLARPAKFSPEDKYAKYRRRWKRDLEMSD